MELQLNSPFMFTTEFALQHVNSGTKAKYYTVNMLEGPISKHEFCSPAPAKRHALDS